MANFVQCKSHAGEDFRSSSLVIQLRTILLMGADFNHHERLFFGKRMMDLAMKHNMVPGEIYSERGKNSGRHNPSAGNYLQPGSAVEAVVNHCASEHNPVL